jgi:hypothetical protein
VRKFFFAAAASSLLLFSCKKNQEEPLRQQPEAALSPAEMYVGYPADKMDCDDCDAALLNVSIQDGALRFTDYDHFFKVRNCLASQVEAAYAAASQMGILNEDFDGEKPLDQFEVWFPGYRSLRRHNNKLEADFVYGGSAEEEIPFVSAISDPVEMTLVSAGGKVWFGNELFDIHNNPYEKSSCINVRQTNKLIYSGIGNFYFRMRNSVFPWPWGTTIYGTTVSLRKNNNNTFTQVVRKVGGQGAGTIYDDECQDSKGFFIAPAVKSRKSITRSYTEFWPGAAIRKNECVTAHYYENLSPLSMYVY